MDTDDAVIGQIIGSRYLVEASIGRGAMGTVYRARHAKVGRAFAIKVLHPNLLADDKVTRRFDREAELAGTLRHANVVGVVDVGETPEGLRYLVMEYADGDTLFDVINDAAPMPAARVIPLVRQLCSGLQHAHERGLIHRDFKPENVIVERDRHGNETARILDFGVAILRDNAASDRERLTTAGIVLGTPHYMAPEHACGETVDHRIDLFALGVICFEMLTGRMPYDGDGVDVARANLMMDTPAMGVRVPNLAVDPLLEAFTRKLMMKSRDERPESAQAARELLDLIERDRDAAAAALGLAPIAAPRTRTARGSGNPPPPASRSLAPAAIAPTALQDAMILEEPPPTPAPPHRRLLGVGIAGGLVLGAAIALIVATRTPPSADREPTPPAAAITAAPPVPTPSPPPPPPPPPPPTPPPPPAPAPAPAPIATAPTPPAIVAVAPPPPARTRTSPRVATVAPRSTHASELGPHAAPHARVPVSAVAAPADPGALAQPTAPAPPPIVEPLPPPAAPSAASVAQLYAAVGRELKRLDQQRGSAATADIWPLYLRVRINDVIADPVKLAEANALLARMHQDIADRAK